MLKKVLMIRHGQTNWNREMRLQGREDIPLNAKGVEQASKLSRSLENKNLSTFFSSPLVRAAKTAHIIAAKHGQTPRLVEGLAEIDFGEWEGLSYEELGEEEKARLNRWLLDPESETPPGGESFNHFRRRVCQCYRELLALPGSNRTVIVTHAGVIKVLVADILKMPFQMMGRLKISHTSLSVLQYDDWDNPYLELLNDTCHLNP